MNSANIGIHQAKTHFSKLIDSVKKGHRITITQRGRPVAVLAPVDDQKLIMNERKIAIAQIRAFKQQQSPMDRDKFRLLLKADQK